MEIGLVNSEWEEMSYQKFQSLNAHQRLQFEKDIDSYKSRYQSYKIKIGYGNTKAKVWIYDSEINAMEDILRR